MDRLYVAQIGVAIALAASAAFAAVEHKTRFDGEMIPGVRDEKIALPLSNGRQIVRTPSGQWLLGFDIPAKGLFLAYGPPACAEGSRFSTPALLVGNGAPALLAEGSEPAGLSLAISGRNLYIAWSDRKGVWMASAILPPVVDTRTLDDLGKSSRPRLVAPDAVLGDIVVNASGAPAIAYSGRDGIFILEGNSSPRQISTAGMEPVIEFDTQQRLHVAYRWQRQLPFSGKPVINTQIGYALAVAGPQPPRVVAHGMSSFPSLVLAGDHPVIAFQYEGLHRLTRDSANYLEQREGGGSGIGYAADVSGVWKTGFVSQAAEIVTRDSSPADAFKGRIYPLVEEKWRPKMALDRYGVPWVFWPDTTRRHTYFARWMGSEFSDAEECRGGYYAPSEYLTAEKHMPATASEIGFAYVAAGRLYFGTVPVPAASSAEKRHFLFLDMLEVSEMSGVTRELNRFEKYRQNPVFTAGEPGTWDDFGASFPNVRHDRGKFTMEYSGHSTTPADVNWNHGFAESTDGIHWTRPQLGVIDRGGSKQNNIVPWVPNFLDLEEPDPARRYKGVRVEGNWITNFHRPIAYSPDGVHWQFGQDTVNLTSLLEGGGPAFRDDMDIPERRFKAVGRTMSESHRALGMMWSPDLIHWYGDEAVLDVEDPYGKPANQWRGRYVAVRILDPSGEKGGDQVYWGTIWIENGLYMCLYAPMQYDGGYQGALAVSRDGFNYMRIRNGQFILPRGPAGAWDSGIIAVGYGINTPLRVGDSVRVYYGGATWHHGTDPWRVPPAIGMAELRPDGWTYIQPARDSGSATTIPIALDQARKLFVNADVPRGGEIRVAVLPQHGSAPVPGYGQSDSRAIGGAALRSRVSWAAGDALPGIGGKVRLRFYLTGTGTRLFSFWFE
jgi:hypothetical protein